MAPDSSDVTRLLAEAARATTLTDQQYFLGEADKARATIAAQASAGNGIDLAQAVVQDTLTPTLVHEHHTAATDWIVDVDTGGADAQVATRQMTAEASVWFGAKSDEVKADPDEFAQQAFGAARKLAGKYGPHADAAERAFLDAVGRLHYQATSHVAFNNGESVGDTWHRPAEGLSNGLPGERTTSERSPAMQDMQSNTGGSSSSGSWPDPITLPQQDVDAANGGNGRAPASTSHYQASLHDAGAHDFTWDNPHQTEMSYKDDLSGQMEMVRTHPDAPNDLSRIPPTSPTAPSPIGEQKPIFREGGENTYQVSTRDFEPGTRQRMSHTFQSFLPNEEHAAEAYAAAIHAHTHGLHPDQVEANCHSVYRPHMSSKKGSSMPQYTAACPECSGCQACGGLHRVAVSGLDQIDQTVDPHDNGPKPTPYPTEVAFPWEMPQDSGQAIAETENQLRQREQLKGASRGNVRQQRAVAAARVAAERAYTNAMRSTAGQDDSGWLGDMGAGGVRPGMQDGGNPGTTYPGNLADPDPVYGYGGDNGNQPLKPYGQDEADDYTNNPGMNYQPGQPTQYDVAGRGNQVGGGQATAGLRLDDPEVMKALRFAQARSAHLSGR